MIYAQVGNIPVASVYASKVRPQVIGSDFKCMAARDFFGSSVRISSDGSTVLASSRDNDGSGIASASVRLFHFNSTNNAYAQVGSIIYGSSGHRFGDSLLNLQIEVRLLWVHHLTKEMERILVACVYHLIPRVVVILKSDQTFTVRQLGTMLVIP